MQRAAASARLNTSLHDPRLRDLRLRDLRLRDPRLLGLIAALLIHLALLGPILLDLLDGGDMPLPSISFTDWTIPLELMPRIPVRIPHSGASPITPLRSGETPRPSTVQPSLGSDRARTVTDLASTEAAVQTQPLPTDRSGPTQAERARIASALRLAAACRNRAEDLTETQQAICDRRHATIQARAAPLSDPAQSAFAAEGAAALAAYEQRRAGLRPSSPETRACPHSTDMMGRCPVQLNLRIFSSQDGFLPGLKKDQ